MTDNVKLYSCFAANKRTTFIKTFPKSAESKNSYQLFLFGVATEEIDKVTILKH